MFREQTEFDHRVDRLSKRHQALAKGYDLRLRADGLLVPKPRRAAPRVPLKALVVFVTGFLLFKGVMLAHIGPEAYQDRLALLQDGTMVERGSVWVLQIDPVSEFVAQQLRPYLS